MRTDQHVDVVDILIADDEWVRREFDALVAAGWDGAVPIGPEPLQGAQWPRRPGYSRRPSQALRPAQRLRGERASTNTRGPPH